MESWYHFNLAGVQGEVTWSSSRANITSPSQSPTSPSSGGFC
jgi:hypothetical protein